MRLAVSRTPRARGRIKRLMVSITIRTGISRVGVPSGSRWPSAWVGRYRSPIMTVANQKGTASPRLSESCVVGVKVYGRRPSMLRESRNTIREAKIRAQACPPLLMGKRSCWVNRLTNQV